MIALLHGDLAFKAPEHVIIDVGGVGYQVHIPLSSFYSLPDSGRVRLHIHTHVTDDAIRLFGFLTAEEKAMFGHLLHVSGVGPKLAVNILSNIAVGELQQALFHGDLRRLSAIPGIGKKSAERLVLELREKMAPNLTATAGALPPPAVASPLDDALSALINLGYKDVLARKALAAIDVPANAGLETMLKAALKNLTN